MSDKWDDMIDKSGAGSLSTDKIEIEAHTLHIDVTQYENVELEGATLNSELRELVEKWRKHEHLTSLQRAADELEAIIDD